MGKRTDTIDRFAEALSEGLSVREASAVVNQTPAYGKTLLHRLRKQMGEQAR